MATGPQQVVNPVPYPPTRTRSVPAKRIALAAGAFAVVAGLVATVLIIGNGDRTVGSGTTSSSTTTTTTTASSTSATTTTRTRTPQDDALMAALPTVYQSAKSCAPTAADKDTVATVRCTTVTVEDPWAPPPAEAEFRLFADQAKQNAFFLALVTSRGIPRMDERGGCRPKSDPIHYALFYRDTSGPLPNEFTTCFLDGGTAQVWWVDTRNLTIGTLKKPGDVDTLDKLDLWWNHQILSAF